jgi:tetratricopeptide (TPR) repeat protein
MEENGYLYTHDKNIHYYDRPDVVKLMGAALRALVKADPDNMNYWNRLGCFDIDHKFYKEAKKCYEAIGDQRDDSVWNKFKFNQGKLAIQANLK